MKTNHIYEVCRIGRIQGDYYLKFYPTDSIKSFKTLRGAINYIGKHHLYYDACIKLEDDTVYYHTFHDGSIKRTTSYKLFGAF